MGCRDVRGMLFVEGGAPRKAECRRAARSWRAVSYRALLFSSILILAMPRNAAGQGGGREDTMADSSWVSERILKVSFAGIKLSPDEEKAARGVIRRIFVALMSLPRNLEYGSPKIVALCEQRDAALLQLVHSRADSVRYLDNSEIFCGPRKSSRR